jgi:glyoxylase-like metal-dependent hydrolase (beta-lactamase superfamily II)
MTWTPSDANFAAGVYRLGGIEAIDGRISWAPDWKGSFLPISCYLVVEDEEAVLVDTGVPAHRAAIAEQVRAIGPKRLQLTATRLNEFDSMGNALSLAGILPVDAIHLHFPALRWVAYEPDGVSPAQLEKTVEARLLADGDAISVDRRGRRPLEVLSAPVRLLKTSWLFDDASGTLFSSDAFGHVPCDSKQGSVSLSAGEDTTSAADVRASLSPKLRWLFGANLREIRVEIETIFSERDVRAIAPGLGRVLVGRETVARHVDLLLQVLAEIEGGSR